MAKLSEIKLPDSSTYEFKDSDAQDAIRHLADSTVSNLINITKIGSYIVDGVHISTNSAGRVYIEGTATADISFLLSEDFFTTDTQSSCVLFVGDATTDGSSDTWWLELSLVGSSYISYDETPIILPEMIMNGDLYLHIKSGTNLGGVGFYPMIVESALYNIGVRSGKYGPTNHDLYLSLKYAQQTISEMDITAGSVTNPIYFANGVPTACTYTVEKSVPSDAVFTDTTYESKSASSGGTALSLVTTGEKYTWNNKVDKVTGKGLSTNDFTDTYKSQITKNRDGIISLLNCSAKNSFNTKSPTTNNATFTDTDNTITVNGSGTWSRVAFELNCQLGANVLSLNVDSVNSSNCRISVAKNANGSSQLGYVNVSSTGAITIDFTLDITNPYVVLYVNNSSTSATTSLIVSNIMLCTKAEWDISSDYVLYAPTNRELYENKADLGDITALETNITSSTSITSYVDALSKGHYATFFTSSSKPTDAPINDNCFVEIFVYSANTAYVRVTPTGTAFFGSTYELNKVSGTWQTQWISHGYGMLIPDNTDINTITTIGDYFIGTGTSAETMTNLPASALFSGHLIVSGLNAVDKTRLIQMYIPAWNATDKIGKIFVRHLINTAQWTDWIMVSDNILMAELVDRDGKNLLANDAGTKSVGTITFTMNSDRTITVSGTSRTSNSDYYICTNMPLKAGTYVLSGCPSGGNNSSTYKLQINGVGYDTGDSYEFTLASDTNITVYIRIWSGYTPNNLVFKPMICTKSDWIASKAYVANALSNLELTQLHTGIQLSSNIDLDTLLTEGVWYGYNAVGSGASNLPVPNGNFNIRVENTMIGAVYLKQSCYIAQMQNVYTEFVRVKNISSSGAWQPWMMITADGAAGLNLVTNDDLNNYTTPGVYQCTGPTVGASLTNSPTAQPFRMEVKYFATTSSIIQEISGINDTTSGACEIYYRVKLSSGWKSWVKISKDMPSTYELGTSLASNSDLNSLTTPGKWYATTATIADTISHNPVSGVAFFGETIPSVAGSRYIQILYPNDDTGDWYKRRYTGSWQTWIKYTGTPMS